MFVADAGLADTIVARATAAGAGARAIIRISGGAAFSLAARVFEGALAVAAPRTRVAGAIAIDDARVPAAAIGWRAPRSFTGDDLVELHLPGSAPLVERVVEALAAAGARAARPGEFTRRAFLAGRLDLAAAEAVLALGQASTEAEAREAARELRAGIGGEVERLRVTLLDALATLEASLDFASEDLEAELLSRAGFHAALEEARSTLDRLLSREAGRSAGDRAPAVLLYGPPNAGKSSLLNALAGADRALVSPIAGTTRDPVSVRVEVAENFSIELIDAAGVSPKEKTAEAQGARRTAETSAVPRGPLRLCGNLPEIAKVSKLGEAAESRAAALTSTVDLVLVVLDGARTMGDAERAVLDATRDRPRLLVLQKADLPRAIDLDVEWEIKAERAMPVSARTGQGLGALRIAIARALAKRGASEGAGVGANARHRACLDRARASLDAVLEGAELPAEVVAIDLRAALDALGELSGASCPEDVLDRIFARFCIGK